MAKKVKAIVKLQITAGKANPAPPVGPALGQHGVWVEQVTTLDPHPVDGINDPLFNFGDPANRRPAWIGAPWPTHPGAGTAVRPGPNPAVKAVRSTPTDRGSRVLVVDDNPVHRMLTSEMLALWGIQALLAVDGSEAVALACERPLELILMDLQMPVLDGLGATRQIRRFELDRTRARVPIVAYTVMHHPDYAALAGSVDGVIKAAGNEAIQSQLRTPVLLTKLLPHGLLGMFAAVMMAAFITTDDTYLHSWGSIFVQDVLLPLKKTPFTVIVGVNTLYRALADAPNFRDIDARSLKLLLAGGMIIAAYLRQPVESGDPGTTTVSAVLVCYGLGVLCWLDELQLAAMLGIGSTVL